MPKFYMRGFMHQRRFYRAVIQPRRQDYGRAQKTENERCKNGVCDFYIHFIRIDFCGGEPGVQGIIAYNGPFFYP